jgi:hypothetical protein
MFDENVAAQGAISSGLLGSPYGSNPQAAQGMTPEQQHAAQLRRLQYNQAVANPSILHGSITGGKILGRAPRLYVEIDKVSNGFVLKCKDDVLIAKDLEELQGLFTAQVAAMLLEDK